jgi:biopolymer transport protein ExbD
MGASFDDGKKGRGKAKNFDLNLVPFIDLLSSLITFLIATAVWNQLSSLNVEQAISDPNSEPPAEQEPDPVPPLTIHIRADGVAVLRKLEEMKNFPAIGDQEYDWKAIEETIKAEAEAHPEKLDVVIVTDDGCRFENMIHALDLTRAYGLEKTLLGGGPASTNASMSTPPAAAPAGG